MAHSTRLCDYRPGLLARAGFFCLLLYPALADAGNRWQLWYQEWPEIELDSAWGPEPLERKLYHFSYSGQRGTFTYEHQPLLVRVGEPAHNGYFHQFRWQRRAQRGDTRIAVEAGMQGSSNIFKYQEPHREALVASFTVMRQLPLAQDAEAGLTGDYRFGPFRVYPRLTSRLDATATSEWLIDLPVALLWRSRAGHWQLGLERHGDKWGALDAEREVKSKVRLQEWRLGGEASLPGGWGSSRLRAGAGISFDSRLVYRDLDLGWQRVSLSPAAYVRLGYSW